MSVQNYNGIKSLYSSSTPVPQALGMWEIPQGMLYGLEIEFSNYPPEAAAQALASAQGRGILKKDTSCGIELVSLPLSAADMLEYISQLNIAALGVDKRCGVHLHISRYILSQYVQGALVAFMHHKDNKQYIELIAGRACNDYCVRIPGKTDLISKNRYEMVNMTSEVTIEIRIFNGTTNTQVLLGYVNWVMQLLEWLKTEPRDLHYSKFLLYQNPRPPLGERIKSILLTKIF
jgi:hypothetical protein